ncbi:perilipin-3-like [Protopterus annectens]|uniref:perilipin-3-like n=1 Tax=Protopterus annectens TaxID=7888 RepID=UPI001CFBC915|nr:perilipin-3-like [Protopterus annectens]
MASNESDVTGTLLNTEDQQSVVSRMANLPLVSSVCDVISSAYANTKENHPYVRTVCDAAEKGVKTFTAVAVSGAQPIIGKLEPQIAAANEYACKGLDKLEEKLPILHQPTEKVVAGTKEMMSSTVTGAKGAVMNTVTGAKDAVSSTVSSVVDMAKGAVQGSVDMTKSVVGNSVNTVLGSRVGQLLVTGVDVALGKSEEWVDNYLPMTEEELAAVAASTEGFEVAPVCSQSYYVRLGTLSSKLRHRAYQHSLGKARQARLKAQEALTQLHNTIDLIDYAKRSVDSANQMLQDAQGKLHQTWLEWREKQPNQNEEELSGRPEQIESQTLAMTRSLTQQVQTTCLSLVSSVSGLPQNIQDQIRQIRSTAEELHGAFSSAHSFRDLSGQILAQSKEKVTIMKESMDGVMEYLLNNMPLSWIVGPFSPQVEQSTLKEAEQQKVETQ